MDNKSCSLCGRKLVRGRAAIRKSLPAKLSWPWASDRLFYKPDGEDQKTETVIREGSSYEAFKCETCGSVLLTKHKWSVGV
jgi:predicted RNA-binding Zn-ribbon protein involved in translation (DUF1610 family)